MNALKGKIIFKAGQNNNSRTLNFIILKLRTAESYTNENKLNINKAKEKIFPFFYMGGIKKNERKFTLGIMIMRIKRNKKIN